MDSNTILWVLLALLVVLFVPFTPFRPVKKLILFFFNRFIPLPIKFDDIGGIPIVGMKMKNVQIKLGPTGSLEAEEMHIKIKFLRLLTLRRPSMNPVTFYKPRIRVKQIKQEGEIWFLFPLTAMKWVLNTLFMNLWGLNVVRIYRGTVIIEGRRGETVIEDFNGEFTSHGSKVKVRRLSCMVGNGSLEIHYPRRGPMKEGRVIVRNMHLEHLVALKVPRHLHGPINIEATMSGSVTDTELVGNISSPCLYMRGEAINDFQSPLRFRGTELILERMQGRMGEYLLEGRLVTDVVTDISELVLRGGGRGKAAQSILKMLAMKPFIEYADLNADVILQGDLNEFYEFGGDIKLKLKDAKIDFSQIGEGSMSAFPLAPIPEAYLHLVLDRGVLKFADCNATFGQLKLYCEGKIDMQHDPEEDRVERSQFEFVFRVDCPELQDLANALTLDGIQLSGAADAVFKLECDYSDHFHKLEGRGRLTASDTRVHGVPAGKFKTVKTPSDLACDTIECDVVLEKDCLKLENVKLAGRWLELEMSGRMGFFDKQLALDGEVSVSPEPIKDNALLRLVPGLDALTRRIRTGFKVSGTKERLRYRLALPDDLRELFRLK